eukprot:5833082-Alexandrium_andersonii.AAC.1
MRDHRAEPPVLEHVSNVVTGRCSTIRSTDTGVGARRHACASRTNAFNTQLCVLRLQPYFAEPSLVGLTNAPAANPSTLALYVRSGISETVGMRVGLAGSEPLGSSC